MPVPPSPRAVPLCLLAFRGSHHRDQSLSSRAPSDCPALALVFSPRCSWRAPRRARRPRPAAPPQTGPAGSAGRRPPQVFSAGAAGAVPPLRPPPKIPGRRRLGCPPAPACAGTSGARLRPAPCQAPGAVAGGPRGAAGLGGASAALREARRGAVGAALC